jgi:tyrosine-protein kinase Etk/Wzc
LNRPDILEPFEDTRVAYATERDTRVTLLDLLIILVQRKWIWIGSAAVCGLMALILGLILPVEYRAETDILPPQRPTSSASMLMGQVGSILGMGGSSFGAKDPNDIFLSLLRSRTTAEALVKRFNLQQVYKKGDIFVAEAELAKHSTIVSTLEGTIVVKVNDRDPTRAAAIANGYIEELTKQNNRLAISEAAQRRLFFQAQLEREKNALEDAEVSLKETELKTGVLQLPGQTELAIRQVADFRAQITNSELELQNLLTGETQTNPDVVRLEERIRTLREDLQKAQANNLGDSRTDVGSLTTSTVPTLAIAYVRKLREVKYHEDLFNMLSRQYEAAKIDEAREAPAIEAIDAAVPPHFRYSPRRQLLIAAGLAIGLILGWIYAITAEILCRSLQEPEYASKWLTLQRTIYGSRRL